MAPRALIVDLDDTLYPERRFLLSGFSAVAAQVEQLFEIPRGEAFRVLVRALRAGHRSTALQALCETFDIDPIMIPELVDVIREHRPRLPLRRDARRLLARMRRAGWRIGLLTNGLPGMQARKISALGLAPLLDHVVYACEHGDGRGKPDPAAFCAAMVRLGVEPERAVFAGDDPWCDVAGARRAGLWSIRVRRGRFAHADVSEACEADLVVSTLSEIPDAAEALVDYAAVYVS
ncbi:MAG: HAD family hydrolase [Acidobacteriota bacterium]|nr:HAD family hydrolase [Acidobacteriota bacterium]